MEKKQNRPDKSAGIGFFSLPAGYEEMTIEQQQQALTDIMRDFGKNLNKVK
jgi:hypothetical protein